MINGKFYEIAEIADMFNRTTVGVSEWYRSGKLKSHKFSGVYAIAENDLLEFLNKNPKYKKYITSEVKIKYGICVDG